MCRCGPGAVLLDARPMSFSSSFFLVGRLSTTPRSRFALIGKTALPTLMVWGKRDTIVPYTGAAIIAGLVPQARLATLDTGMHCIAIERPVEVADIMSNWWSDLK